MPGAEVLVGLGQHQRDFQHGAPSKLVMVVRLAKRR